MGNRSRCQSPGAFGKKVLEGMAFRVPAGDLRTGDIVLDVEAKGIPPTLLVRNIVGVVRPSRGRALWKNQSMTRKGFKPVKYSKVLKDAQKQTAEAKEREKMNPAAVNRQGKGWRLPKKITSIFQRKGA